jgi:hypothetical protein
MLEVKNSLENGVLREVVTEYDKQLNELFQAYWNWEQKKIELNSMALLFKDFKVSPEYILPKTLADTYKSISKGQTLDYAGFTECLAKCSFRSEKLTGESGAEEGVDPKPFKSLLSRLRMKEGNYKEVVKVVKNHLE